MNEPILNPKLKNLVNDLIIVHEKESTGMQLSQEDLSLLLRELERALVDRDYLKQYLRYLDTQLPRPAPYQDLLDEKEQHAVLTGGLACLEARKLAILAVNPYQLLDLHETIEYYPWSVRANFAGKPGQAIVPESEKPDRSMREFFESAIRKIYEAKTESTTVSGEEQSGAVEDGGSSEGSAADNESLLTWVHGQLRAVLDEWWREERPINHKEIRGIVNELYVRLHEDPPFAEPASCDFFLTIAADIRARLIEQIEQELRSQQGPSSSLSSGSTVVGTDSVFTPPCCHHPEWVLIPSARWTEFANSDPTAARIYLLFHFAGRTVREIGRLLRLREQQVADDKNMADAYLGRVVQRIN